MCGAVISRARGRWRIRCGCGIRKRHPGIRPIFGDSPKPCVRPSASQKAGVTEVFGGSNSDTSNVLSSWAVARYTAYASGGMGLAEMGIGVIRQVASWISSWGGCRMNRKGFTLIELLIVVVIIGILAAIAIPKFANTKEKAYLASMKSDLRNLVTAEEAYFADSVKYTTDLGTNFNTTSGVVGPTIATSADGWTAWVKHTTTTKTCAIYVGSTSLAPASKEGEPKCI